MTRFPNLTQRLCPPARFEALDEHLRELIGSLMTIGQIAKALKAKERQLKDLLTDDVLLALDIGLCLLKDHSAGTLATKYAITLDQGDAVRDARPSVREVISHLRQMKKA